MSTVQQFDYSANLLQALLWQDENTFATKTLLASKQYWYDTYNLGFWQDWYTDVFNLDTANLFGISVWSSILGLPLYIPLAPDPANKPLFGFNEIPSINNYLNFDNSNFSQINQVEILTLEEQRLVLKMRYFQLTSSTAVPEVNAFLNYVFSKPDQVYTGKVVVLDDLDMSITVVFDYKIPDVLLDVIRKNDLIPRAAGVFVRYLVPTGQPAFGFDVTPAETGYLNFDNGNFYMYLGDYDGNDSS